MTENKKVGLAKAESEEKIDRIVEDEIRKLMDLIILFIHSCCVDSDSFFGHAFMQEMKTILRVMIYKSIKTRGNTLNIRRRCIDFVALAGGQAEIHFAEKDFAANPSHKISVSEKSKLLFKVAKWAVRQERSRYDRWLSKQKWSVHLNSKRWRRGWKEKIQNKMEFFSVFIESHEEINTL